MYLHFVFSHIALMFCAQGRSSGVDLSMRNKCTLQADLKSSVLDGIVDGFEDVRL